jgi:hypothetical protein
MLQVFNNPKWVREGMDKILASVLSLHAQKRDQFFVEGVYRIASPEFSDFSGG